jgi:heptosyltransferase-2/heptosyltransferase-3
MAAPSVQPIVIWFGRVGDLILMSALLEILRRRYGSPCHLIGAGSWLAQLYASHPDVARVSCLRRYTAWVFDPAWWRTRRALRASGAAPVYVCETDPRKLARIERLLGAGGIAPARRLYIAPPVSAARAHWVDRLVDFARLTPPALNAADYPWPSPAPRAAPLLQVAAAARTECAAWLAAQGWGEQPLVLVQPGNRRTMRGRGLRLSAADDKAWPLERWAQLLHQLHRHLPQARIIVCGAPREKLLLKWIAAETQLAAVRPAELPLPRLLALCERAHSMVSVDTGPAHAAAALSLPLVVLFGAHSQREWLPRGPSGSQVLGVGGPPYSERLEQISVDTVFAAWCALNGRSAPPPGEHAPAAALTSPAARATAP